MWPVAVVVIPLPVQLKPPDIVRANLHAILVASPVVRLKMYPVCVLDPPSGGMPMEVSFVTQIVGPDPDPRADIYEDLRRFDRPV